MADTTFISKVTHILASWLNPVNIAVYRAIGAGGVAPATPGNVRDNLGLTATGGAALVGNNTGGGSAGATVQAALDLKAPIAAPHFTGLVQSDGAVQFYSTLVVEGLISGWGGVVAPQPFPAGFQSTAGLFARTTTAGAHPAAINGAMFVNTLVIPSSTSFEWNQLNRLDNYAAIGENVGFYSQAYKNGAGSTWAGVFEAHDTTHIQPEAALYSLELDVSANHADVSSLGFPQRYGQILVGYRDYGPNTSLTGSIAGNVLTVTSVAQGQVSIGQGFSGSGFTANTFITALGTGAGLTGTYIVNNAQTVASKDMVLTGCVFTAKIDNGGGVAGNTLTVTAVGTNANGSFTGKLVVGAEIFCAGLPEGVTITGLGTGTGGTGTYTTSGAAALILPDTTTMVLNGGTINHIGSGLWIGAQIGDPGGTVFTNQINLAGNGDTGILLSGYVEVGVALVGHYSTASIESITPSSVPIISSVGSMNNALIQFAATDPMHVGGAAGTFNSRLKIIIDGNPYYLHIFNP